VKNRDVDKLVQQLKQHVAAEIGIYHEFVPETAWTFLNMQSKK
jgi:hypothetical protein